MPIVDFEQDPEMPVGTGNFRDDRGRVMYLSDPETASRFIKTMPGRSLGGAVAAESTALATGAMGGAAPAAGPDQRTAMNNANDTGLPTPVGDVRAPVPGAPAVTAPTPPAPAAPAAAPSPAPTPAPAPGPAGAAGVDLVKKLDQLPKRPAPAAPPSAASAPQPALPVSGISTTTMQGANKRRVGQQIAEEDRAVAGLNASREQLAADKDTRTAAAIDTQIRGAEQEGVGEVDNVGRAVRRQNYAERRQEQVRAELKANDEMMDPDRLVRNMSTGKKIAMVILAGLNGGFGALNGQKDNGVMNILNAEIDRDIDNQKQQIASGRIRIGNELDRYIKMGFDAETAEKLARDRLQAAVRRSTELQAQKLAVEGENAANAAFLTEQSGVEQARRRGDLLATTDDRTQVTTQREAPKAANGADAAIKAMELELKALELTQKRIAQSNADELAAEVYGVDKDGRPKGRITPDEKKDLESRVQTVGPAFAELAPAINMTDELVTSLGGTLNKETGEIEWKGDVKGVGPIDAAGGYLGVNPVTAPFVQAARAANLYRADVDKAREKQNALKEYVTSQMTGANSTLRQDATYGTMVGGDFTNEDQTRENVEAWARTLLAARKAHATRLGQAGMVLMRRNEAAAAQGAPITSLRPGVN
jgi:hypothetical protein